MKKVLVLVAIILVAIPSLGMLRSPGLDTPGLTTESVGWTHLSQAVKDSIQGAADSLYLANGAVTWSKLAQAVRDSIQKARVDSIVWAQLSQDVKDSIQAAHPDSVTVTHHADEADSAYVSEFSYQMQYAGYDSIPGGAHEVLIATPGVLANPTYANTQILITPCNVFPKGALVYDSLYTGGFRVTQYTPLGASINGRAHFSWAIVRHQAGGM
jgi:hypothetical protein